MMDDEGDERALQIKADVLDPEETWIKNQQTKTLRGLIENLPPRYNKLITLRYFDELSYEEIAAHLDLPIGTVKGQLFKARYLLSSVVSHIKKDEI